MRRRYSLEEKYYLDVQEVASLVLSSAKSYEKVEGYDEQTALQVAMSDYSFWHSTDPVRLIKLENLLERIKKASNEPAKPLLKEPMDFQEGKILYDHLLTLTEDVLEKNLPSFQQKLLHSVFPKKYSENEGTNPIQEELLHVLFPNQISLDVGYYGRNATYRKGFFNVILFKHGQETQPLFSKNVYTLDELKTVIEEAVNLYERWTK